MTAPTSSTTVLALLSKLTVILENSQHFKIENPEGDAREIMANVIGCSPSSLRLHYDDPVPYEGGVTKALRMAKLRMTGEPIQYILGSWSFMGREYKVGRGVLIPRDDTEVVTEAAIELMRGVHRPAVIDLCSGSGVIAITLKKELDHATVCAVEKSPEAFRYLRLNADINGAELWSREADIFACADDFDDGVFDLIVSNPPYIKSGEIADLQTEVQFEPRMALDGGESGYDFYDAIVRFWTPKLKEGGCIAFELGEDQFDHVAALLRENGYTDIKGYPDIQGITRAVTAHRLPLSREG